MKAISLLQPWADAIFYLGKDIENRSWNTHHRGVLAVHVSKGWDKQGEEFLKHAFKDWTPDRAKAMRGGIFGLMWVFDTLKFDKDFPIYGHPDLIKNQWAFGPWCWRLGTGADGNGQPKAVVVKEPAMIGGRLGLWEVQDGIIDLDGFK